MQKKIFYILFAICISCTEEVEYIRSGNLHKPVVNCFLTPDSTIKIFLHKINMYENIDFEPINNAEIFFICKEDTIPVKYNKEGFYQTERKPNQLAKYYLSIAAQNYSEIISSEDSIPAITKIDSAAYIYPYETVTTEFIIGDISGGYIEFTDNLQTTDFYEFAVLCKGAVIEYNENTNQYDTLGFTCSSSRISSDDYFVVAEGLNDYEPHTILLSDKLINGQKVRLNFRNYDGGLIYILRSVSESYYKYKKSLAMNIYNSQIHNIDQFSDISNYSIIGNPVEVYSNIEGGLGIFAGYSSHTIKVWYNYNDSVYYEH